MPQSVVTNTLSQESAQVDTNANDSVAFSSPFRFTDSQDSSNSAIDSAENKSLNGPGIFKNHILKPVNPNARPLNDTISDWLTFRLS